MSSITPSVDDESSLKRRHMPTKTSRSPAVPVVTHHLPLCCCCCCCRITDLWAVPGQTLSSSSAQGLAFICRWVELHEKPRERRKRWICACREEKTVCEREREREKPLLELCVCSIRKLLETEPRHREEREREREREGAQSAARRQITRRKILVWLGPLGTFFACREIWGQGLALVLAEVKSEAERGRFSWLPQRTHSSWPNILQLRGLFWSFRRH